MKYSHDGWTNIRGQVNYYDYNDVPTYGTTLGLLMKIAYPEVEAGTATVEFTYWSNGQLKEKKDPNGVITRYEYNTVGSGATLKKVIVDYGTGKLNITTEFTYDSVGNVATVKNPRGYTTTNQYYNSRLLKKVIAPSPFSYATEYVYYDDGKLQHVKQNTSEDGWIYHQSIKYNARGMKKEVKGPYKSGQDLGINKTTFEYDNLGRLTKVTDAENNVTETKYYPDGRVWRVIDAEDHNNVTNTYDANGLLIKVEDAKSNATQYEYNGFGGLKKTIYPDGTWTAPTYSSIREVRSVRTRAGDTIEMWYDDLKRVKRKVTPEQTIKYKYDLRGRLIETYEYNVFAPKAKLIKNTYDDIGRITKVEYDGDKEVSYEYDACSNRTKLTYPDNTYITYEYDNLNRLTKIKNQGGSTLAQYTYDSRSRRTDLDYLNGTYVDYTYDAANRLTTIDSTTDNDGHEYDYTYDKVGNRLTMLVNDTDTHTYTYDDIYQITDVDYPTGYSFDDDTTFSYDDVGNRTSVVDDGTTNYTANNLNQYNSVGGVYYDYDLNGNTTFDAVAYYTYDSENRLISATNADGSVGGILNAAVDNMDLTFTLAGDANWAPIRPDAQDPNYGGPDSAKSGEIDASENTYFDATVDGKGTVKFYYKKDAGTNDCFRFKVDGWTKRSVYNSAASWTQFSYVISSTGSHTLRWQYEKGSSGTSEDGGAWVDRIEWIPNTGTPPAPSLAEGLDCEHTITTGGDASWYATNSAYDSYYDGDVAKSGSIDDSEQTWMQTTVTASAGDKVSFYWKVSSETSDYLKFYIDSNYQDQISGEKDWQKKSYSLSAGSRTLKWVYSKDSSGDSGNDCGWVDGLVVGTESLVIPPDDTSEALDSHLKFTESGEAGWSIASGADDEYYYDGDALESDSNDTRLQTIVESDSSETIKFYWKVSCRNNYDYLRFYIDDTLQDSITGEQDWQQKSYSISSGIHTLKWVYDDGGDSSGDECGWVDFVQWSGPSPDQDPSEFQTINYKHDLYGRRSEKKVDGYSTRYLYDGPHVTAEYDGNNNLLRKYIYGPYIDQPVCMIEVAESETYYYHYDGLGSVVALSDSSGDTVQTYEYSVYGRVAAEDEDHPNPYMFAGRRYDIEIGLYYNRARYYNPFMGRFLQADPIGYGDGMNMYAYCGNSPTGWVDPSGLVTADEWIEMATGTYFMIFVDDSESMNFHYPGENDKIMDAIDEFIDILAIACYKGDVDLASSYVIVNEWSDVITDDNYDPHYDQWVWMLADWNEADETSTRYVNIVFIVESEGKYYHRWSDDKVPDDTYIYDLSGLINEVEKNRTFSIGKVFHIGGADDAEYWFNIHLNYAFNYMYGYGWLDDYWPSLTEMGVTYENIHSGLTARDYLDYLLQIFNNQPYIRDPEE